MRHKTYLDFDEFAVSVEGVDCKMMLRNPANRAWSVAGVDVDTIDVQLGQLSSGNIAQGELRPDGFMLYVPLSSNVEYVASGNVVERDACVLMDPGCEFCFSTKEAHDWGAIFIPAKYIAENDEQISSSTESVSAQCRVTRSDRTAANTLRASIRQLFRTAAKSSQFESTEAAKNAAWEIFTGVSSLVNWGPSPELVELGRPRVSRELVIRRSMEFLDQKLPTSVRISELAAAAGVSQRTLRAVFNEYYGIGPIRYLQLRHLHQVRRALKAAHAEQTTVSQILIAHGEWAFSRFASRYKQLFGELPSETLRKPGR